MSEYFELVYISFIAALVLVVAMPIAFRLALAGLGGLTILSQRLAGSYIGAFDDFSAAQRKRTIHESLIRPKRTNSVNRDQAAKIERARDFDYGLESLSELMTSCSACHMATRDLFNLPDLHSLRNNSELIERRRSVEELREVFLELYPAEVVSSDPVLSGKVCHVSLTREFCGVGPCHLITTQGEEGQHLCAAAKLLRARSGGASEHPTS